MREEIDTIIKRLILLDGNETRFLNSKLSYENYKTIIIQIIRIKYGIRYHNYTRECQCQPEYEIRKILRDDTKLNYWLKDNNMLEQIIELIDSKVNANINIWGE